MHGNGKYKNKEYSCFYDCFHWVKSISSKRAGVNRFMMNQVNPLKDPWMMHCPVHPVEISVMQECHYREGKKEIQFSMLINIRIEFCVFC